MSYLLIRLTNTFTIWREGVVGGVGSTYCTDCSRKIACTTMPIYYCIKSRGKILFLQTRITFRKYFSCLFIVETKLSCCYL
jgi:hypothetical protein